MEKSNVIRVLNMGVVLDHIATKRHSVLYLELIIPRIVKEDV